MASYFASNLSLNIIRHAKINQCQIYNTNYQNALQNNLHAITWRLYCAYGLGFLTFWCSLKSIREWAGWSVRSYEVVEDIYPYVSDKATCQSLDAKLHHPMRKHSHTDSSFVRSMPARGILEIIDNKHTSVLFLIPPCICRANLSIA